MKVKYVGVVFVDTKLINRIHASISGAGLAGILYGLFIAVLLYFNINFYELPVWFHDFALPGAIFLNMDPTGGLILGVPTMHILSSFIIYMSIGYIIDWIYDPYK